jgi:hypothetical protein
MMFFCGELSNYIASPVVSLTSSFRSLLNKISQVLLLSGNFICPN